MNSLAYQVVIIVNNEQDTISAKLDELNASMDGKTWILQVVLNGSEDNSVVEVARFGQDRSNSKNVHLWEYDHHDDVEELKQKVVKEIIERSGQYPIIVLWDDIPQSLQKSF